MDHHWKTVVAIVLMAAGLGMSGGSSAKAEGDVMRVYIGSADQGEKGGIHRFSFDLNSGRLEPEGVTEVGGNAMFLTLSPDKRHMISVGRAPKGDGGASDLVASYAVDPDTGELTKQNAQSAAGKGVCHVSVDATGRTVFVANYSDGSVTSLPFDDDGKLSPAESSIKHDGPIISTTQKSPHAHSILPSPGNRFAIVADLGLDQVIVYRFDPVASTLNTHEPTGVTLKAGAGPRHIAFHPNKKFVYVINEHGSTVDVLMWNEAAGRLTPVQNITTLRPGVEGKNYCAEVAVHPNGKFLYGSNRGHNSIVLFGIDPTNGKLKTLAHHGTQGDWPRHFAISPDGRWLIVTNEKSNAIQTFRLDADTGQLEPLGDPIAVPRPVCVLFDDRG